MLRPRLLLAGRRSRVSSGFVLTGGEVRGHARQHEVRVVGLGTCWLPRSGNNLLGVLHLIALVLGYLIKRLALTAPSGMSMWRSSLWVHLPNQMP